MNTLFHEVASSEEDKVCFEQINPAAHMRWPSDALQPVSAMIKNQLWTVMLTSSPYSRHYIFLRQSGDIVLPQTLSIYALFYYFSSVTRYRPSQFQDFLKSKYGGFINEFINNQIVQFLYIMATEFIKREVSKPKLSVI